MARASLAAARPSLIRAIVAFVALAHLVVLARVALVPTAIDGASAAVNLVPFETIRRAFHPGAGDQLRIAVLNLFVLFPAGLYLPILFGRLRSGLALAAVALVGGASIELGQLAISIAIGHLYRSIDIDDVIVNTAGLALGLVVARMSISSTRTRRQPATSS